MQCFQSNLKGGLLLSTVIIFVLCLSSCGGGSSSSGGGGGGNQDSAQHLYVTTGSQILKFRLPITNSSAPSVIVSNPTNPAAEAVAVDSTGNLATNDAAGNLSIYTSPLSNSSTPSATFSNSTFTDVRALAFDPSGDLFAGGFTTTASGTGINVFKPPLSSASTPAQTISLPGFSAVDSSGNLYLAQSAFPQCNVQTLAPPYTGTPTTILTQACPDTSISKIAVTNTQIAVSFVISLGGFVTVNPLPGASSPSGTISTPGNPGPVAVDSSGNLYVVGDFRSPTITVFAPPFSSSSVPAATLTVSNASSILGMAVGK